jgi:hypothetical protein
MNDLHPKNKKREIKRADILGQPVTISKLISSVSLCKTKAIFLPY